ncbi:MAG: Uncharacterised protein [Hyphomonas sp. TMED17]|nr:MAG: Uncharacterised protein [Hyphomonas sp. TMED17]
MAHALPTNFSQRNFDTAFLTDNAAILDPLIFPTKAFIIFDRAKDSGAKQTVAFRLERPIINRLGFLDLA